MAVYGYTRVSTVRQVKEGESLDAQEEQIRGYAKGQQLRNEVVMFVEKGVSGSVELTERPEGKRLLGLVKKGDTIITPKLDRMFRDAFDALGAFRKLQKLGVSLHMIDLGGDVTGNGVAKIVFTILAAVAEWERDRTRERIQEVKADQKRRRRFLGGTVPFGFALAEDGTLVKDERQQSAIRRMSALYVRGITLRSIAARMTADGFPISHVGVKKVMQARGVTRPAKRRSEAAA